MINYSNPKKKDAEKWKTWKMWGGKHHRKSCFHTVSASFWGLQKITLDKFVGEPPMFIGLYRLHRLPSGYLTSPWKDPPIFKFGKPSISMGHLYHGYVSHNQMVNLHLPHQKG